MACMRMGLRRLCGGFCLVALFGAAAGESPAESAKPGNADAPAPAQMELVPAGEAVLMRWGVLGHNQTQDDWNGSAKRSPFFWDVQKQEPDAALLPLTNAFPLRMMRFHSGNHLNWREVVGPVAERKAPKDHWKAALNAYPALGEYLEWARMLPGAPELSLIASPFRPVEEVADLVAYCNAIEGPMAQLRARNGHPETYGVMIWELGNECDWEKREDLNLMRGDSEKEKASRLPVEEYIALCRERIAAMRKVDPAIRIYAHAKTAPWSVQNPDWPKWHRAILKELASEINGIVVHPYYDGYPVADVYSKTIDPIIADLRAASTPEHPLTLWISEHARWIDYSDRKLWPQSWGIGGAISTADFLMQAMSRPEIEYANYWCHGHSGPWRVLSRENGPDGKPEVKPTAIFALFQLLNRAALDEVQPLQVRGLPEAAGVSALAFRAGVRRSLLVCNRSPEQAVEFALPAFTGQTAVRLLVSNPAGEDGSARYEQSVVEPQQGRVMIPPHSVAAWLWQD